jgi:C_GCAxxG_C_C family probable redox protein
MKPTLLLMFEVQSIAIHEERFHRDSYLRRKWMMTEGVSRDLAKYWWLQCVACSEASMTTQMRGFGFDEPVYEQALHAFSGGFMHLGHACGLLTGAALATGYLAREIFDDDETRATSALYTTIQLARAHPELTGSVNCREITEVDLTNLSGRLRYLREGKGRMCGRLHLKWSPQAHGLIDKALTEFEDDRPERACSNCAVKTLNGVANSVDMEEEDSVLVAGFAGGMGLLGNVCGALAAGVYALSVSQYLEHGNEKRDSRIKGSFQELTGASFRGPATELRLAFVDRFESELCIHITQRQFEDIVDYSAYIEQGGCQEVIEFVIDWIEDLSARK